MIRDLLGRPLKNLRLSVTDRCNLRCSYCMPEAEYTWLPRHDLLQFEEMSTLVDVFARAGVDRVRVTGGEPLLRRDLASLVAMIAHKPGLNDLALTTNGILLEDQIDQFVVVHTLDDDGVDLEGAEDTVGRLHARPDALDLVESG